jgi:hypothetical protein
MVLAAGAVTPTVAPTASVELCGAAIEGGFERCVSAKGHRGRHAYRSISEYSIALNEATKEEPVADPKEVPAGSYPDDDGRDDGYPTGALPTVTPAAAVAAVKEMEDKHWQPDEDDFINLKGKMYLPARRRVQWFREAHPDWTIDTQTEEFARGKRIGPGRVEEGFAVVRANIFDPDGRLISTGLKSEYSENFADFLEKAETGAIARALAIAGYGTENALDLDEGVDAERIADAPVSKPVRVKPSAVPGVGRGGKTEASSVAQIRRVAELSRTLGLGAVGLAGVIESIMGRPLPEMPADEEGQNTVVRLFLAQASAEEVGALIVSLEAAIGK